MSHQPRVRVGSLWVLRLPPRDFYCHFETSTFAALLTILTIMDHQHPTSDQMWDGQAPTRTSTKCKICQFLLLAGGATTTTNNCTVDVFKAQIGPSTVELRQLVSRENVKICYGATVSVQHKLRLLIIFDHEFDHTAQCWALNMQMFVMSVCQDLSTAQTVGQHMVWKRCRQRGPSYSFSLNINNSVKLSINFINEWMNLHY